MNFAFIKKHSFIVSILAVIAVISGGIAARSAGQKKTQTGQDSNKPSVSLISLKQYKNNGRSVAANGIVSSMQQVDLKAQASGKITKLFVSLGDKVSAGQTLATIDSGNAAAALTSATGMLEQARANYNKLLAGASNEQINVAQKAVNAAQAALDTATNNAATIKAQQDTAVSSAYATLLNTSLAAIAATTNVDGVTPTITGTYSGSDEGSYKITLYQTGLGMKFQTTGIESALGDVKTQPVPLGSKGLYIQFSSFPAVSDTWTVNIPNDSAAGYTATNNAYQLALRGRESAMAQAQAQITGAQSALDSAKAALAQVQAQARPADVQAAQAAITSAEGQVLAAQVAYRNTLIQAPFSGKISAVPVKLADLVNPGQTVMSLVNEGGLQVKVFLSDSDLQAVSVNTSASIGSSMATGTVTNVAPAVDAGSKTGEVDVAVADPGSSGLTVGQTVPVVLAGSNGSGDGVLLPIQTVKFTPDGKTYVYAIDDHSKAKEIEVTTGRVSGETVEVTGGLDFDTSIVSNAYAVSAGDEVRLTGSPQ